MSCRQEWVTEPSVSVVVRVAGTIIIVDSWMGVRNKFGRSSCCRSQSDQPNRPRPFLRDDILVVPGPRLMTSLHNREFATERALGAFTNRGRESNHTVRKNPQAYCQEEPPAYSRPTPRKNPRPTLGTLRKKSRPTLGLRKKPRSRRENAKQFSDIVNNYAELT